MCIINQNYIYVSFLHFCHYLLCYKIIFFIKILFFFFIIASLPRAGLKNNVKYKLCQSSLPHSVLNKNHSFFYQACYSWTFCDQVCGALLYLAMASYLAKTQGNLKLIFGGLSLNRSPSFLYFYSTTSGCLIIPISNFHLLNSLGSVMWYIKSCYYYV